MHPNVFCRLVLLLLLGALAGARVLGGEAEMMPLVTNLLQLREFAGAKNRSVANIVITGTVCDADARAGWLILQDAGATEALQLEPGYPHLEPGQDVRLMGQGCEITRRRTGIGLRRLPLVDNDGLHGVVEKSATMQLDVGRHPITVEWFNAGGAASLSVEFSGPGFERTKIPDGALSHEVFSAANDLPALLPGLKVRFFEGFWRLVPDFGFWPEAGMGEAANFTLPDTVQNTRIGCVFSGFLTVTQAGEYRFYLRSDDGSQLYLGEPSPRVEVIGEGPAPAARPIYIGQIAGTNDPGRWATVEGVVRHAAPQGRRLELDLRSPSNNRMQVDMLDADGLPPGYLLNSKVRLTGVARQVFSAGGQSIFGLFTASGVGRVQLLEMPNETWQQYPLQSITNVIPLTNQNRIVRLSGTLEKMAGAAAVEVVNASGRIRLKDAVLSSALPKGPVEAIGVLDRDGTNPVLRNAAIRVVYTSATTKLPLLTSAQQVLQLSREQADRGYPVHLRGVITCVWPDDPCNYVLQDNTRGVFLLQSNLTFAVRAQAGEFWDVQGVTRGGSFSPMIYVQAMEHIGDGRLPEPAHAEWDQLVNGSLDNQYVEIEGVVLEVKTNTLVLLAHSGRIVINAFGESPPGLEQFENKLVRLRGCLQAVWDGRTHQVKVGDIRMGNLSINVERALSADPFAAPERQVPELRLYDMQANAFRRVKLTGQFLHQRAGEAFMMNGSNGLRFISNTALGLRPGELIEVAGIPDLRGEAPVLREAVARKIGVQSLPVPKELTSENFLAPENDSQRVAIEGTLIDVIPGRDELALEIRAWSRSFAARVALPATAPAWQPGSQVRVIGVYVWHPKTMDGGLAGDAFELLVRSPLDVQVLSRPPWWTFKKLLLALGILAGGLALASGWIVLLRRQVERRTAQLERANRRREQAEQARALEEERLRIARDLHDDLGSSLTEITMLGGMGLAEKETARVDVISQIVKKARDSVNALDVIVWAVNPRENTLQSLADYLASFADEFLSTSGVTGRLDMPVSFPEVVLDGRVRHDLFLATKEALNNAIRHAHATEVDVSMAFELGGLVITVKDNGCGFDPATKSSAHGLGNLRGRLEKLGGQCHVDAAPGRGTKVTLKLQVVPLG